MCHAKSIDEWAGQKEPAPTTGAFTICFDSALSLDDYISTEEMLNLDLEGDLDFVLGQDICNI